MADNGTMNDDPGRSSATGDEPGSPGPMALGERYLLAAAVQYDLAETRGNKPAMDDAMVLYRKALDVLVPAVGTEHVLVARAFAGMGQVYFLKGEFSTALPLLSKALDIATPLWGVPHPDLIGPLTIIGAIHSHSKEYDRAIDVFYIVLQMVAFCHGMDDIQFYRMHYNLGLLCERKHSWRNTLRTAICTIFCWLAKVVMFATSLQDAH